MLLPLSLFCAVAIFADDSIESAHNTATKPQAFTMHFNANELGKDMPISPEDLDKTKIITPVVDSFSPRHISIVASLVNYVGCDIFHSPIGCASQYDAFEQGESLQSFFNNMETDKKYAQDFWSTKHHQGARYIAPTIPYIKDAQSDDSIPCVFCPNINGKDQEPTHGVFLYTDNLALCEALRMRNNNFSTPRIPHRKK